jgi:hypothetical protein
MGGPCVWVPGHVIPQGKRVMSERQVNQVSAIRWD